MLHKSRLHDVALFALMFVFLKTGTNLDAIGCMPYFHLSQSHVARLVHNLLITLAPILEEKWVGGKERPAAWFSAN